MAGKTFENLGKKVDQAVESLERRIRPLPTVRLIAGSLEGRQLDTLQIVAAKLEHFARSAPFSVSFNGLTQRVGDGTAPDDYRTQYSFELVPKLGTTREAFLQAMSDFYSMMNRELFALAVSAPDALEIQIIAELVRSEGEVNRKFRSSE